MYSTQEDQWHNEKACIRQKDARYDFDDNMIAIERRTENLIHERYLF